jgi:DNA adenine methylase
MRYLGGKAKIAKQLAAIIAPNNPWWDPFCGGLGMSVALSAYGPGIVSDIHPGLIALYRAVANGWIPPTVVSEDDYRAARDLPADDPYKAFVGFACSFGGVWFGGYARLNGGSSERSRTTAPTAGQSKTIVRQIRSILSARCEIDNLDFFEVSPISDCTLYLDPPYQGTRKYPGVAPFDHDLFWNRCVEWADAGSQVYVSEYSDPPVDCAELWSAPKLLRLKIGQDTWARERLFRVL